MFSPFSFIIMANFISMSLKEFPKLRVNNNGKAINPSGASGLWWQPAMEILAKVTGLIAGPIVIALFVGRWLDERYDSEPWLFLASMGLAFAISSIGIVKITLDYIKKIEREAQDKKDNADNTDNSPMAH